MVANKKFYLSGAQISSDFLKMFEYPLGGGNANTVLQDPYSIVLTQSTAQNTFGYEDPIGKIVRFENRHDLKVTGIIKDLPANSSLFFNYTWLPFSYYEQNNDMSKARPARTAMKQNSYRCLLRLKSNASYAVSRKKNKRPGENR